MKTKEEKKANIRCDAGALRACTKSERGWKEKKKQKYENERGKAI